jgi:hypothetical protein
MGARYFAELQYFVNCIIHNLKPSPSGEDGLKDLEAIFLATRANGLLIENTQ